MRNAMHQLASIRVEAANCKFISDRVEDDAMKQMFDELAEQLYGLAELIDRGLLERHPVGEA